MAVFFQTRKVLQDRTSGSAEVLNNFISCLSNDLKGNDVEKLHDALSILLNDFVNTFPDMQVISHFVSYLNAEIKPDDPIQEIIQSLKRYQSDWKNFADRIGQALINKIQRKSFTVLLHSNSSTVINVLRIIKRSHFLIKAFQTRSGPENEGEIQAKALLNLGIDVTLIPDPDVILLGSKLDYCFLGADSIFRDYWVNKTGSEKIARFCDSHKIPVYILADPRKMVKHPLEKDPKITNQFLEAIPIDMGVVIKP